MMELLLEHEQYEVHGDLDGVMSTLVEYPVFELHPQNLRISGTEAVRELYGHLLPRSDGQLANSGATNQAPTLKSRITAYADSLLVTEVHEQMTLSVGTTAFMRMLVLVHYEDGKILGERLYADTELAELISSVLGRDFVELPGVTTIVDEFPGAVPVLERHA
jgi:hypothetical protein